MDPRSTTAPIRARGLLRALACLTLAALAVDGHAQTPKTLYLLDTATPDPNGFNQGPQPFLSRTPPAGPQATVFVDANDPPLTWTLTPALQAPLTIDAGFIPVTLNLSKNSSSPPLAPRTLSVALATTGASTGPLGSPVTVTFPAPPATGPAAIQFDIPLAAVTTLPAATQITLTLSNVTAGSGTRRIRLYPTSGGASSRIDLPALTVINVDTAAAFDAAYPAGVPQATFVTGSTVFIRADVSDPFGTFDIAGVSIDVVDALGAPILSGAAMTLVATPTGSVATYEVALSLPPAAAPGPWTYRVTATEGTEGTVTDSANGAFAVAGPRLLVSKSVIALTDPVNGATNPKAVPGATMLYTLNVSNGGSTPVDAGSLILVDALPASTALYVDTGGGDPVVFVDGSPSSGLSYSYATDVAFSNQVGGGPPYTYLPVPDGAGFDTAVTGIRITPGGALANDSGSGAPGFELRYRLRID